MAHTGGGDLLIGDQPLDQYLRALIVRLDSADDQARLLGCLAKYDASVSLNADDTGFVFDKAKEIALSFY